MNHLAAERLQRPRHAGVVAERLASYQAEVRERLRQAELERARAEVKALEERKRRRLRAVVALLMLLVVLGAGGGAWWQQQQRARADLAVSKALAQAELLAEQARADPLQTNKYHQALEAARVASQLAESASAEARPRAQELIARLEWEAEAAQKDRELLVALLDVREPHEGPKYQSDTKGTMTAMAEPTADEQFAAAFRRWGLDVDGTAASEAAALLNARPPLVVMEVSAALDEWASERRRRGQAKDQWQPLNDLAALLDQEPGSRRREMRQIMARGRLPLERTLGVLSAALRPVPLPVEVPLGPDRSRLRQLAEQTDAAREPILGLLTLVRALNAAGDEARAEQLLRAAIMARPREVVLHHTLGQLLVSQRPPRWAEAVECYGAARTLRPDLGVNLANAYLESGRDHEGLDLLARLASEARTNPYLHFQLAYALESKGQLDEAMAEYRQAIDLDPKYSLAHNNLGVALRNKRRLDEAIVEFRQTIALDPKNTFPHNNLGSILLAKGRLEEAAGEYRQAIRLKPDNAAAHCNLGHVLKKQGRFEEALAAFRQGHKLGSNQPGWRYPSAQWVRDAKRMLVLDKKLPAILSGEASPANPGEAVVVAEMCQQPYMKRYAASARLYAEAFAADPKLAADRNEQHRYRAACSATLAAAGKGEDAHALPNRDVATFRRKALDWLRDDLTADAKLAEQNNLAAKQMIQQRLTHWRRDPDLASVRDPQALERLPEKERDDWQALWRDVDKLAKRMAK